MDLNEKNIKMIIFDLDDTLVATYKNELKRVKKAAIEACGIKISKNKFNNYYGIPNFKKQMKEMLNINNIDTFLNVFNQLLQDYKYKQIIKMKYIEKLKKEKIIIGIISNSRRNKSDQKISQELKNAVDFNYAIEDLNEAKPNADIIKHVLKKYDIKSQDCIYVGDSITDYEFAKNGHINFVKVNSPIHNFVVERNEYKNVNKFINSFVRERNKC